MPKAGAGGGNRRYTRPADRGPDEGCDRLGGEPGRRMAANIELDGLYELHAALTEERQNIVASVVKLRGTRRRKGTFVQGDGSAAGPRVAAVQQQIEVVEAIIARLVEARG